MDTVRAAAIQFEHTPNDKDANFAKIRQFAADAAAQRVQILAFPECCITGYWHLRKLSKEQLLALAEPVFDGPSSQELMRLAKEHGLTIGAGLIEVADDGALYNSYVVAMPNGEFQRHRKIHCFISEHCASGNEFTVFDTPHGFRAGVLICYDNNINENARITALKGAQVLMAPHQTGGCYTGNPHLMGTIDFNLWHNRKANPGAIEAELRSEKGRGWLMRWLPSRAHDNGFFMLFANGVGIDDDEIRTGNAMILDPYGRILAETGKADDAMVVADLDLSLIDNSSGRRWIRARRPELYGPLTVPTGDEQNTRDIKFDYEKEE